MKVNEIRAWVSEIRTLQAENDYEFAHSKEDQLHLAFIRHVANETTDPILKEMALEVLKADDISFPRWCA